MMESVTVTTTEVAAWVGEKDRASARKPYQPRMWGVEPGGP